MLLEEQILLTKSISQSRGEAKKSDLHMELPPYIVLSLASDHLYGKWLFTWLVLVMSLFVSYVLLSFIPQGVLKEI